MILNLTVDFALKILKSDSFIAVFGQTARRFGPCPLKPTVKSVGKSAKSVEAKMSGINKSQFAQRLTIALEMFNLQWSRLVRRIHHNLFRPAFSFKFPSFGIR